MILFSRNISVFLAKVNPIGMKCDIVRSTTKTYMLCLISITTYHKIQQPVQFVILSYHLGHKIADIYKLFLKEHIFNHRAFTGIEI